jgi:hypothetical protein
MLPMSDEQVPSVVYERRQPAEAEKKQKQRV